jgi:hypothetical protein
MEYDLIRSDKTIIESIFHCNESEYLGIILSGMGYDLKNPLLHYSSNLVFENKMDYFGINFGYNKNEIYSKLNKDEKKEYFEKDNEIIINKILELSIKYKKIFFIGKSIGTGTIRRCIKISAIKNKSYLILLTPPGEEWENFIDENEDTNMEIFVIGSLMDKLYTVRNLFKIYDKKNIQLYELKNGDHSLEINDTFKDIEQLGIIIEKINKFIEKNK